MTTDQSRALTMLKKVKAFRVEHGGVFAPGSKAVERFDQNEVFIGQLETQADDQQGGEAGGHGGTASKTARVKMLEKRIKAVVDTGKTVFASDPDLQKQMRMPRHGKVSAIQTFARNLKTTVTPYQAAFVAEEMPADFLAQLQSAIDAIGDAEGDQDTSDLQHIGATTNLEKVARDAIKNVRDLDSPINNRFADNADVLSEWDSASHIQVGLVGRHADAPAPV